MLYAPSPYSSGTEVSVYEQDAYPTIDVTSSISSDADFNHETNTLPNTTDEDNFFFLSQLQNDAAILQQYNNNNNNSNNSNSNIVDNMDENNNNLDNNNNVYISYDNNFEENKNSNNNNKNLDNIIHEEDEDEDEEEEEEEEEEENSTYNINNHYHYLQQSYPFDPSNQSLYSSPTITDDDFETANRAFHATINKFSRQTYPEHRRRAPYSFLENWHLHSMYSKSQQILLGIAHVRPMVLLSGDDFMFTPPLLQQEDEEEYMDDNNLHHDHQLRYLDQPTQMDWIDGEEMFEDDGDILDDGIVIMSAPDPPSISHHTQNYHHYSNNSNNSNNTNNCNDHDDQDEPLISHSTTSTILNENAWMKNTVGGNLLQQQQQEEASTENDSLYLSAGFSSELVHWYRSSDRGRPPSTIMEVSFEDDPIKDNSDNNNNSNEDIDHVEYEITEVEGDVDINTNNEQYFLDNSNSESYINVETEYIDKDGNSRNDTISISNQLTTSEGLKPLDYQNTHTIYQSLTDITPPIQSTPVTITDVTNNEEDHNDDDEVEDEEVLHKYGSISECNKDQFASTSTHHDYYYPERYPTNYANFSNQLTATSDLVLTIASEYHSSKSNTMIDTTATENNKNKNEISFLQCLLCIWQVFFLTAELALAMLLGQHDQQQQLPVIMNNPKKSNRYRLNNNTNNTVTEHILPF